ncbi:hypothetical protein KKE60_08290 [Patescibacteria group bacterium]|nr:hypothetical protein [Patescibacteria group bacterium]
MASQKPELVKAFPECPWCGSTEIGAEMAINHLGLKEKGMFKETDLISSTKILVPLLNPAIAVLTVPFMLQEVDCCGGCGRNRVIRISVMELPMSMVPKGQG